MMTSPILPQLSLGSAGGPTSLGGLPPLAAPATGSGGAGFVDALKSAVAEVSHLQNNATKSVEQLQLGQTDDVTGVMVNVEKGELALKTLLAIRGKLMSALDEIRNMPI